MMACAKVASLDQWGTFDLANYGDLLFPLVLEREVRRRLGDVQMVLSSPHGGPFIADPRRQVRRIVRFEEVDFYSQALACDAIICGGGDIIRFDDSSLSGIYGIEKDEAAAGRMYRLFLEDLGRLARVRPVAWNAVGVPFDFTPQQARHVRTAVECVRYLSVRDQRSKERLEAAGIERDIRIVPDSAFLVPRVFDAMELKAVFGRLKAQGFFPASGRVLAFQVSFASGALAEALAGILREVGREWPDLQLVLLPVGNCHGDLEILWKIRELVGDETHMVEAELSPVEIAAAIAHSDVFVGSSLHGNITAFAFGVPSLFLSLPRYSPSKLAESAALMGRAACVVSSVEGLPAQLRALLAGQYLVDSERYHLITQQIDAHFDRLLSSIVGDGDAGYEDQRAIDLDLEHRQLAGAMAAQFAAKDQAVEELAGQLEVREGVIRDLSLERRQLAAALAAQLAAKDQAVEELAGQLEEREGVIRDLSAHLAEISNSRGWALLQSMWRARQRLVPKGSRRERIMGLGGRATREYADEGLRSVAVKGARYAWRQLGRGARSSAFPSVAAYAEWIAKNEPGPEELARQVQVSQGLDYKPLLSIITPVYNPAIGALRETIDSVLEQTYDRWELCLVDGGSTDPAIPVLLAEYARQDSRVRVKRLNGNLGISENSNAALAMATGEFVALLDHDDTLAPSALYEIVRLLNEDRSWDLIYSDHDVLTADGASRFRPLFKPDWSPEIMLSANYMTHLTVMRTDLVHEVGGFAAEMDGAQDWDLFLRIAERTDRLAHVPKILYHWRNSPGSTAVDVANKTYASARQLTAVERHLTRCGLRDVSASFSASGFIRLSWAQQESSVSIIIPSNGANDLLQRCVASILSRTAFRDYEIVIVNNGTRRPEEFAYYQDVIRDSRVRVLHYEGAFNYSAVCNFGAQHARGGQLLFLNNDMRVLDPEWLDELVLWAGYEQVGVVGAKLLAPDGRIQHAGVSIGLTGFAGHVFAGAQEYAGGIFGFAEWYRDYLAVTGACLMVRRGVFERAGGFSEDFLLCGSDVEFCLRVCAMGYRIVYNPFARLEHVGSATHQGRIPAQDFEVSLQTYLPVLSAGDPYYNPNLSYWHPVPTLRAAAEQPPLEYAKRYVESVKRGA